MEKQSVNSSCDFDSKISGNYNSILIVSLLFAAFSILSNLTTIKIVAFAHFYFPAGLIFIPVTYIFDDILTEVYGFKVSRAVIWSVLLANTTVILGTTLTVFLNPAPFWHGQQAYSTVFLAAPRVFVASIIAYFFGEFSNSILLAKLKVMHQGERLWLRFLLSTLVGVGVDTTLFAHIAFLNTMSYDKLLDILFSVYTVKVTYEILALPLTYKVCNYLKRIDNSDYYDYNTSFNPFSLKMRD